jgi:very-short-patch-repair endonuclease
MKNRRKRLRRDSTEPERLVWDELRRKKLGFKFFRQYSVEGYVVDFYCPEKRIAIEIDGIIHKFTQEYDKYRAQYLSAFNIKVVRFTNTEVENNLLGVISNIKIQLGSPS